MDDKNNGARAELAGTAAAYLGRLSAGIAALADRVRFTLTDGLGGSAEMAEIAAGIGWSMDAMRILGGGGFAADFARAEASLKKALEAALNEDSVFFADMLEYEVKPVVERWRDWIVS
ncbi:MAG: hypothetical protein FWC55_08070 [Firmicutes bacterium]|nr:hypothetical protein [Bacillota bacterium]